MGIKGYKIWSINEKPTRTFVSKNVIFNEEALTQSKVKTEITTPNTDEKKDSKLVVESLNEEKQQRKQTNS